MGFWCWGLMLDVGFGFYVWFNGGWFTGVVVFVLIMWFMVDGWVGLVLLVYFFLLVFVWLI